MKTFKLLLLWVVLLLSCHLFSQQAKTPKEQFKLSKQYSEKASWFTFMPQYNADSTQYYAEKAIKVLNSHEPIHQTELLKLNLKKLKNENENLPLLSKDSLLEIAWNQVKDLNRDDKDIRLLLFGYLSYWSDIKMVKGERQESLDFLSRAIAMLENDKLPETQAKVNLYKGLFYAKYGLPEEKPLAAENLHKSRLYYESVGMDKNPSELYMIYAQLVYQHTGSNQDSTNFYYDRTKSILEAYKKPMAYIWYYTMKSYDLIQQALENNENNREMYFTEAKENVDKTLGIMETYNLQGNTFYPYCFELLADIDFHTKNYEAALDKYIKSYDIYKSLNDNYYSSLQLKNIADTYKEMEDYKNALVYETKFYDESLKTEKAKNERSLRENELQLNLLTQEKTLAKKRNLQTILFIALGIGVLVLGFIYRNYRLKQKNNLKLKRLNQELNTKNEQNELLLKEIHHRVKNNLELVKSLLALQSAKLDDSATKDAMIASQNRVQSMGIIHQKLYQGENLGSIEMKDYFINLGEGILDSFNSEDKVRIECAMDNLELDVDTAVPIGLIVNELLTNALKYAFPKDGKGNIKISLKQSAPETLTLKVADNGVGKTKNSLPKGTGFGTQLVELLTQQLNGKMNEINDHGTSVEFQFQINPAA